MDPIAYLVNGHFLGEIYHFYGESDHPWGSIITLGWQSQGERFWNVDPSLEQEGGHSGTPTWSATPTAQESPR